MNTLLTLHDPETARRRYIDGVWRRDTLYSLLADHAAERRGAFALRDGSRRITWAQLRPWVDAVAADLHAAGLRRGQRVSAWLPSRAEAVVVFLACSRNGYVYNPLHRNHTVREVLALAERIGSAALFVEPGYGSGGESAEILEAARALPAMRRVYAVDPAGGEARLPHAAAFPAAGASAHPVPVDDDPDKIVYLAFTSGTSGTPKGVMHSDNTLLANGRALVADWNHDGNTILLSLSPLSHHIGTVAIEQMLVAGMELVTNDPPPGTSPVDWIPRTGATYVMGVPTHAIDVLAELRRRERARLGDVRVFYMAGSPIPSETAAEFLERGITPQNVYGMTESGSHQYTLPTDGRETIVGTCGRACRGYEVRLFDPANPDVEVATGEIGEIGGRGASLMLGYFANQQATEDAFNRDGWFLTGDLGRMDERGCLQIVGRKKDVIIRGGHNIHPASIEELAMRCAAVLQAAAFPIADERLGERVCLAVVPAGGARAEGPSILAHLHAAGLSRYDMPEWFVVLDELPRTASGKVLKRELVEWARSGRIRPEPVRWAGPPGEGRPRDGEARET